MALFVNSLKRGQKTMRTLLLLPYLLPTVTVALSWRMMLSPNYGIVNQVLQALHLPVYNWFSDIHTAFGMLVLIDVWQSAPFVFLLLYAAPAIRAAEPVRGCTDRRREPLQDPFM